MSSLTVERQPYPLYDTTFTLHRLSPLHVSTTLPISTTILQYHAQRFREVLVGDVLRGVRVGVENDALTAAGALKIVSWRLLPPEDAWNVPQSEEETRLEDTTGTIDASRGILVIIEYERNTYTAILLKEDNSVQDNFQHFPLLMTKMPGSLREALIQYLTTSFDTHISNLHISSGFIVGALERYLTEVGLAEDGDELESIERNRALRSIVKEVEVFVGFDLPGASNALRTVEIHLLREDIPQLLSNGKKLQPNSNTSPFMEALTRYVQSHLALDLKNEHVKVVRVACGAFVLGMEGKIKVTGFTRETQLDEQQFRATTSLINSLIELAAA
jgi:hypothetical protein